MRLIDNVGQTPQTNADLLLALEWLRLLGGGGSSAPRELDDEYYICGNRFTRWFRRLRRKPCEGVNLKNQFKKLAENALKTPEKLNYSPDLLRICLELAKSQKAFLPKAKFARQRLVDAIEWSSIKVPKLPDSDRVQRQMNDLCLILDSEANKLPRDMLELADVLKGFNGSERSLCNADKFLSLYCYRLIEMGSVAHHCVVKLLEELNLYCLSQGIIVNWTGVPKSELSPQSVITLFGSRLADEIKDKKLEHYLFTAGLPGSNPSLIGQAIRRDQLRQNLHLKCGLALNTIIKSSTMISHDQSSGDATRDCSTGGRDAADDEITTAEVHLESQTNSAVHN